MNHFMNTWESTRLWKKLQQFANEESKKIVSFLEHQMPIIEMILKSGGTGPKDFTLHDENHSYRVAEKIVDIIPEDTFSHILNEYEIGLLLLASYLHDIGMTPKLMKIETHLEYILNGNPKILNEFEINDLIDWIDNSDFNVEVPLCDEGGKYSHNDYVKAKQIVLNYTRSKHNEWSKEWITNNLPDGGSIYGKYTNYRSDLITICESHHWGLDFLKSDILNPITINSTHIVHKRYLAMCLRVADVLEIDPERTPSIIFSHRNITKASIPYWQKDHYITVTLIDNKISLYSYPDSAYIHKAVLETGRQIEDELRLCTNLVAIKPLNELAPHHNLQHAWSILPDLFFDIRPQNDKYQYIDGSFRPNTKKLIEILGGESLYSEPLLAIRELVQNALDAVNEKITYERINSDLDNNEMELFGKKHFIFLTLKKQDEKLLFTCQDSGSGMNIDILKNNFLVGGADENIATKRLKRTCKERKITYERIGKFGIGVLSYFMIAEKIRIVTRRCLEAGDSENNGWQFIIDGLFDFGELSKAELNTHGSTVSLTLNDKIRNKFESDFHLSNTISEFLKQLIGYSPCVIRFSSEINSNDNFEFCYGWNDINPECIYDELFRIDHNNEREKKFINVEKKTLQLDRKEFRKALYRITKSKVKYLIVDEHDNEFDVRYKIIIPYFQLNNGRCLVYIDDDVYENKLQFNRLTSAGGSENCYFVALNTRNMSHEVSIKGIKIRDNHILNLNIGNLDCLVRMNFLTDKYFDYPASRNGIAVNDNHAESIKTLVHRIRTRITKEIKELDTGFFSEINLYFSIDTFLLTDGEVKHDIFKWFKKTDNENRLDWSAFSEDFCIKISNNNEYHLFYENGADSNNRFLYSVQNDLYSLSFNSLQLESSLICLNSDYSYTTIWKNYPLVSIDKEYNTPFAVNFENTTKNFIGIFIDSRHYRSSYINKQIFGEITTIHKKSQFVSDVINENISISSDNIDSVFEKDIFLMLILQVVTDNNEEFWTAFSNDYPLRIKTAFKSYFSDFTIDDKLTFIVESEFGDFMGVLTPTELINVDSKDDYNIYIPPQII